MWALAGFLCQLVLAAPTDWREHAVPMRGESVQLNEFSVTHPVGYLRLIAGLDGANGAINFNGAARGAVTLVIPVSYRIEALRQNDDAVLPHLPAVIRVVSPVPLTVSPAFPRRERQAGRGNSAGRMIASQLQRGARRCLSGHVRSAGPRTG